MCSAPQDDPLQHEALFRAAEIKALRNPNRPALRAVPFAANEAPPDQRLLQAAWRELERRAIRRRYLPDELMADVGWWILLDLFVSEFEILTIKVTEAPKRWNLSHATAARQIAALIEANLVMRVFADTGFGPVTLRLTNRGQALLKRVLALCD